jgi:serine protease Do
MAKEVLNDLKSKGKVTRGWLGVSVQDITEDIAANMGIKEKEGALVADVVKGDPAEKAGLRTGDVIVEIDGKKVHDTHELLRIVAGVPVGKTVVLKAVRDGRLQNFNITVAERKDQELASAQERSGDYFGMTLQDITPSIAESLGLRDRSGVIVTSVQEGSPADEAGIKPRDVIIQVNKVNIKSMKDFQREMGKKGAKDGALLLVKSGGAAHYVVVRK